MYWESNTGLCVTLSSISELNAKMYRVWKKEISAHSSCKSEDTAACVRL
jgi:hypothetical protein